MQIKRAAVFGTGQSADFCWRYCTENGIEVCFFVDDFSSGEKNGVSIITFEEYAVRQFDTDAIMAGKWQKGGVDKRAGIVRPVIIIDEKSLKDYWLEYDMPANMERLASCKDRHKGSRCFIIGNGPSLAMGDLDRLRDEITFASNKIFLAFDKTDWRPSYLFVEDLLVAEQNSGELNSLSLEKFIEKETLRHLSPENTSVYEFAHYDSGSKFSFSPLHGIFLGHSVVCSQIQFAHYMGFSEIYLLGIDFSFSYAPKKAGKLFDRIDCFEYDGTVNHFTPEYRKEGELWTYPDLDAQRAFYGYTQKNVVSDTFRIYNASRKTKLDVFPMTDFDSLFQDL